MPPESRPKSANAPISFAFSNAMKSLSETPNINNMPAHAWNTSPHTQTTPASLPSVSTPMARPPVSISASQATSPPSSTEATVFKKARTASSVLSAEQTTSTPVSTEPNVFKKARTASSLSAEHAASPPISTEPNVFKKARTASSLSVTQATSPPISTEPNVFKKAKTTSSSLSAAPLLASLTAENRLPMATSSSPVTPQVIHSAPGEKAAPDTAASSPLSSAPPSPLDPPPQIAPVTESIPPKPAAWALPAPIQQASNFPERTQVATDVTHGSNAAPHSNFFPPVNRSFGAASTLSTNPLISRMPNSNAGWNSTSSLQAAAFPSIHVPNALHPQGMAPGPYRLDPYKVELEFRALATRFPIGYETLVGLYLQDSGRTPAQIGENVTYSLCCRGWERDLRRSDTLDANPQAAVERWIVPNDPLFLTIAVEAGRYAGPFEASIRWFAKNEDRSGLKIEHIVRKAGWTTWIETSDSPDFKVMHNIFIMEEGEEKSRYLAQARQESPLFFQYCLRDPFCGTYSKKKRNHADEDLTIVISYTPQGRKELEIEPKAKRIKMDTARPMQVHNVPLEERAFDSKGNRLPWALEWPEGHPNARGQKRYVDEKGPFGKSNKRKGSSRTRTATPAKKENPTLDSFEKALNYDLKKQAESPTDTTTPSRPQSDAPSVNKEPTQVLLYGYPSSRQWQVIDTYEKISGGIICEDYERQPDASLRRYPNTISNAPRAHMIRPLTRAEKTLAFQYAGGAHWVKVTFDSAEAAERAIENSPIQVQQHWVYAQLYYPGIAPQQDAPIATTPEERALGRPLTKHSQIYGPSSMQQANAPQGGLFTAPPTSTSTTPSQPQEPHSLTSSTASSGTATGSETAANLRHRNTAQAGQQVQAHQAANPRMMRFFPDTPRTVLRPAHEALLPQPTFWERQFRWLADHGLMPGEIIGNGVPVLDNGEIDWHRASFYWKFFYWVDSTFGTDYCGLRNDD